MTHLVPEHKMEWPNVCCRCGIHPIETWLPSGDGNQDGYCGSCEGLVLDAQEQAEAEKAWGVTP